GGEGGEERGGWVGGKEVTARRTGGENLEAATMGRNAGSPSMNRAVHAGSGATHVPADMQPNLDTIRRHYDELVEMLQVLQSQNTAVTVIEPDETDFTMGDETDRIEAALLRVRRTLRWLVFFAVLVLLAQVQSCVKAMLAAVPLVMKLDLGRFGWL